MEGMLVAAGLLGSIGGGGALIYGVKFDADGRRSIRSLWMIIGSVLIAIGVVGGLAFIFGQAEYVRVHPLQTAAATVGLAVILSVAVLQSMGMVDIRTWVHRLARLRHLRFGYRWADQSEIETRPTPPTHAEDIAAGRPVPAGPAQTDLATMIPAAISESDRALVLRYRNEKQATLRAAMAGLDQMDLENARKKYGTQKDADPEPEWRPPLASGLSDADWVVKKPAYCEWRQRVLVAGRGLLAQLRSLPENVPDSETSKWYQAVKTWRGQKLWPWVNVYWGVEAQQRITSDAMADGAKYEATALPPEWRKKLVGEVGARTAWIEQQPGCPETETGGFTS